MTTAGIDFSEHSFVSVFFRYELVKAVMALVAFSIFASRSSGVRPSLFKRSCEETRDDLCKKKESLWVCPRESRDTESGREEVVVAKALQNKPFVVVVATATTRTITASSRKRNNGWCMVECLLVLFDCFIVFLFVRAGFR